MSLRKVHKEQGSLKDFCLASDFEAVVDCFIELIQPYRTAPLPAQEAMEHIVNLMPAMYGTEKWMLKETACPTTAWPGCVPRRAAARARRLRRSVQAAGAAPLWIVSAYGSSAAKVS